MQFANLLLIRLLQTIVVVWVVRQHRLRRLSPDRQSGNLAPIFT